MGDLHTLAVDAWTPEVSHLIKSHLLEVSHKWYIDAGIGVTVYMAECGCAFHEWNAVLAMKATGLNITRLVLMDSAMDKHFDKHGATWAKLATINNIELVTKKSYIHLLEYVQNHSNNCNVVLYINGSLRFSKAYCTNPALCKAAAIQFWTWCDQHACNKTPLNFVSCTPTQPAGAVSWAMLANKFATDS